VIASLLSANRAKIAWLFVRTQILPETSSGNIRKRLVKISLLMPGRGEIACRIISAAWASPDVRK
jgi:hypothetical protein